MVQLEAPLQQIMGLTIFFLAEVAVVEQMHLGEKELLVVVAHMALFPVPVAAVKMALVQIIMGAAVVPVQEMGAPGREVLTPGVMARRGL